MIHDGMPYDPIQGKVQVTEVPNVWKWLISKAIFSTKYLYNQKTNGELWYSKTMSKF